MTTSVIIGSNGPDAVKVEIQGRDKHGRFREVGEVVLQPGQFQTFILHKDQSLATFEVPAAPKNPQTPDTAKVQTGG